MLHPAIAAGVETMVTVTQTISQYSSTTLPNILNIRLTTTADSDEKCFSIKNIHHHGVAVK
jgi:hypothetical protein